MEENDSLWSYDVTIDIHNIRYTCMTGQGISLKPNTSYVKKNRFARFSNWKFRLKFLVLIRQHSFKMIYNVINNIEFLDTKQIDGKKYIVCKRNANAAHMWLW